MNGIWGADTTALRAVSTQMERGAAAYPNASPEELAVHIKRAIAKGDLLVIDKGGSIAWSDQVEPGQTREPKEKGG